MNKDVEKFRAAIIKELSDEAKRLYLKSSKDEQLRISGIARAIKIIEEYNG